jgi:hypothetical protein
MKHAPFDMQHARSDAYAAKTKHPRAGAGACAHTHAYTRTHTIDAHRRAFSYAMHASCRPHALRRNLPTEYADGAIKQRRESARGVAAQVTLRV